MSLMRCVCCSGALGCITHETHEVKRTVDMDHHMHPSCVDIELVETMGAPHKPIITFSFI